MRKRSFYQRLVKGKVSKSINVESSASEWKPLPFVCIVAEKERGIFDVSIHEIFVSLASNASATCDEFSVT